MTTATALPHSGFAIERTDAEDDGALLRLSGELGFADSAALWRRMGELMKPPAPRYRIEMSGVRALDGANAALILELAARARAAGASVEIAGATGHVREVLALYEPRPGVDARQPEQKRTGVLDDLGRATLEILEVTRDIFGFIGDVVMAGASALRSPQTIRWRAVGRLMERTGADALPIVVLITFLMGLVTAFQAAVQLKQVGANIFVADLVGLSMTRELGPLMTAIIAAGRSGAAFAAELGTMRVSEEVDALRTLEIDPYRFLVFPRVLALVLVMPLLTLVADAVGILGGAVVGMLSLDLTLTAYMIETQGVLTVWDVFSGVLKAVTFAMAIAMIACQRGLGTHGGAEGVGRSTTSAVVTILFALILIDAAFTVFFHVFGL